MKKVAKGKWTIRILRILSKHACNLGELVEVLTSNYTPDSFGKMLAQARKHHIANERWLEEKIMHGEEILRFRTRCKNLVQWLKKDGLITTRTAKSKRSFLITSKGRRRLKILLKRQSEALPVPDYGKQPSGHMTAVSFDIPERERSKRQWLREALHEMGFSMKQKSLWIGRVKIPDGFIADLRELKIAECVECFAIKKLGSLRDEENGLDSTIVESNPLKD
ncbi:MAG: hypothetical protein KGJ13_02755 [Patescibacteria group bacterium]|nr:hypothetical protein [Patescibacteria group bacterium]